MSDLFADYVGPVIVIVLLVAFLAFVVFACVCCFCYPCSFDHFFASGFLLIERSFCTTCGKNLMPRCECGALAMTSGYCRDCGYCFDQPKLPAPEVTGDE